jgi:hypothetical protein
MTIPFDMRRLHHGCGESLKIKPCVLCCLERQSRRQNRAGVGLVPEQPDDWTIDQAREYLERLWG